MRRMLVVVLITAPAAAWGQTYLPGKMPFVTPQAGKPGYEPAPVPSQDITAPRPPAPVPGEPGFTAGFANPTQPLRSGSGYTPGSNFSEELQRRNRGGPSVTPGFAITVPLDK